MPKRLAGLFLVCGLIWSLVASVEMPPFQGPDESAHFRRATQLADVVLLGDRLGPGQSGGTLDLGVALAAAPFFPVPFHPDVKVTATMYEQAHRVRWGSGSFAANFANTAIYPPFLYIPSVIAIRLGRGLSLSVVHTLYLARGLSGIAASVVASVAIAEAGTAAVWLFAVLSLAMSLALMATCSQDGMMIALAALSAGLMADAMRQRTPLAAGRFAVACLALAPVVMGRPPYAPLVVLLLAPRTPRLRWRVAGALLVLALAVGWAAAAWVQVMVHARTDVEINSSAQLAFLLRAPGHIVTVAWYTLDMGGRIYLKGFIGWLGWLDTPLPAAYHRAAWALLALAAFATLRGQAAPTIQVRAILLALFALLSTAGAIFAIQYINWSPVGGDMADGVQGRYFLPPAMFLACTLPVLFRAGRFSLLPTLAVAALPILSIAVALRAIVLRYYLG